MQTMTSHHFEGTGYKSPIDNQTYDLLQALVSKCEAIEAYAKYEQDSDDEGRNLFQQLGQQDARAAEQILEELRRKLGSSTS